MNSRDLSYEEMSKGSKVFEDSEEPTDRVGYQNDYEQRRNSEFDQSGFGK